MLFASYEYRPLQLQHQLVWYSSEWYEQPTFRLRMLNQGICDHMHLFDRKRYWLDAHHSVMSIEITRKFRIQLYSRCFQILVYCREIWTGKIARNKAEQRKTWKADAGQQETRLGFAAHFVFQLQKKSRKPFPAKLPFSATLLDRRSYHNSSSVPCFTIRSTFLERLRYRDIDFSEFLNSRWVSYVCIKRFRSFQNTFLYNKKIFHNPLQFIK